LSFLAKVTCSTSRLRQPMLGPADAGTVDGGPLRRRPINGLPLYVSRKQSTAAQITLNV
jgi:hypothetical protein